MLLQVLAGLAYADTTVVLQPEDPLTGQGASDVHFASDGTTFPAGEEFVLSIPIEQSELRGSVTVWPWVLEKTCGDVPSKGNQIHRLALSSTTDKKALQAKVPALQIGQPYCVAVDLRWPVSTTRWDDITTRVAAKWAPSTGGPGLPDCSEKALETALSSELATEAAAIGVADTSGLGAQVATAYPTKTGEVACSARATAEAEALTAQAALAPQTAFVAERAAVLAAAAPVVARFEAPLVFIGKSVRPVTEVVGDPAVTDGALAEALGQIRKNRAANAEGWEIAIQSILQAADVPARAKALAAVRKGVPTPKGYAGEELLFYTEAGVAVRPNDWLRSPGSEGLSLAAAHNQLRSAAAWRFVGAAEKQRTEIDKLGKAVSDYEDAVDKRLTAVKDAQASNNVLDEKSAALHDIVVKALREPYVRQSVLVSAAPIKVRTAAAGGIKTPSVPNYAAVQTGIAVALPGIVYESMDATPSFVPYVGVNLYAQPVDREIDLKYIVGSTFLQRVSLVFGATLTTEPLRLPGRTTEAAFGTWYPVAGVSYRLHNYLNVTGGAVMYRLQDANPASREAPLRATPFLALSLDADVVKLLTDAIP